MTPAPAPAEAERLAHDLAVYLGDEAVELFPAWETLPFERVSPGVETMGRRTRVLWRLRDPARLPAVVVASVRALVQRLGPHAEDAEPIVVRPGQQLDRDELVSDLVAVGYRREDEVDRLTEFSVADQRSLADLADAAIFPCRELLPTPEVRERADRLVGLEPWGRDQWERLAEGPMFDGMGAWLPWLTKDEHVLLDIVGDGAQVLLCEPRRMRDRAADLLAEEADLAATLAVTWGATADRSANHGFPRLHVDFDGLLRRTKAPAWHVVSVPDSPDTPQVQGSGWDPVVGDGSGLLSRLVRLSGEGYGIVVGADGEGSALRLR